MNEEEIQKYRESIALYGVFLQDMGEVGKGVARALIPRPVKNKMLELMAGIRAQTAPNNQASGGNPGNPSNQGAQATNSNITSRTGPFGFLRPKPPQQPQAPPPPTEEEKRQMAEGQKLKELEDKQRLGKEKRRRLDTLRGLSVDRS